MAARLISAVVDIRSRIAGRPYAADDAHGNPPHPQPYCRLVFCDVTPELPRFLRLLGLLVPWSATMRTIMYGNAWLWGTEAIIGMKNRRFRAPCTVRHRHA